tara:strand:+ start:121 stop:411 length:291 start_codon:yes stop_codon:yes gene_type:complete
MKIKSRKLIIFVVALVIFLGNAFLENPIPESTLEQLLALVISWLVAQGIADHGAQGTANAAMRAAKAGEKIIEEVKDLNLTEPEEKPEEEPKELTE